MLRRRYLPLRHDTTIHALVQVLIEVAFPEQETRYVQATIKQTGAYRKPRYDIPCFLQDRPESVQSLCLLNIQRGTSIPASYITQLDPTSSGKFELKKTNSHSEGDNQWEVDICNGTCTCPSFISAHVPCKHMFAIFHHYTQWSWNSLPKELTESVHMTLDTPTCMDNVMSSNDADIITQECSEMTQEIPVHSTQGTQIYRLQKQIEEILGRCRSLAFLTNDPSCLQQALTQCKTVMDTLMTSAADTAQPHLPPIFHSIAKAGVEEFKCSTKTEHRRGIKRKGNNEANPNGKRKKYQGINPLTDITNKGPGRPRQKRLRRKPFHFPRQVNSQVKTKMLKAASIVQRGMQL